MKHGTFLLMIKILLVPKGIPLYIRYIQTHNGVADHPSPREQGTGRQTIIKDVTYVGICSHPSQRCQIEAK